MQRLSYFFPDFTPHIGGKSIALFPDGKILAVGSASNGLDEDFVLMRFLPDGTLDSTFGQQGKIWTDFASGNDRAHSVAIDTMQEIIAVAGETTQGTKTEFALAKYRYGSSVGRPELVPNIYSASLAPNPLSSNATLSFRLLEPDRISIEVYDLNSRKIRELLLEDFRGIGTHQFEVSLAGLAKGVYLLNIQGQKSQGLTLKMLKK